MCNKHKEHVIEMTTESMWIKWLQNTYCAMNTFIKVQAAQEKDMKTDVNSLIMGFICIVLFV